MGRTAASRWTTKLGTNPSLWYGVEDSQFFVGNGQFIPVPNLNPTPSFHAIKYGGDWGGLWGNPATWGDLSPSHSSEKIVPYLFIRPEQWSKYRNIIGGLFTDGYPAVILDVEESWVGQENTLRQLLQSLNLEDNLIGLCGYAWYESSLWPDSGVAFGRAVNDLDIVYLPMIYMSDWGSVTDGMARTASDLRRIVPDLPYVTVWDTAALQMPASERERVPRIAESFWESKSLDSALWKEAFTESHLAPIEWPADTTLDVPGQINTALGQALAYLDELGTEGELNVDVLHAAMDCVHTARRLNHGE